MYLSYLLVLSNEKVQILTDSENGYFLPENWDFKACMSTMDNCGVCEWDLLYVLLQIAISNLKSEEKPGFLCVGTWANFGWPQKAKNRRNHTIRALISTKIVPRLRF